MQSNWTAPSLMNSSLKLCLHHQDMSGSVQLVIPKLGTRCGVSGQLHALGTRCGVSDQLHALAFNPLIPGCVALSAILDVVENR